MRVWGAVAVLETRAGDAEQERAQEVGEDERRGRGGAAADEVEALDGDGDAVGLRVLGGRADGLQLVVDAGDRAPAELGRGDRQDAGAAAEVHDAGGVGRVLDGFVGQQLEAEPRRVVRAGPERLAGIDDQVHQVVAGGLPRRADVEPAGDLDRPVELAPAVGPVVGDLGRDDLDQRAARGRLDVRQVRQLARRAVDRVLDEAVGQIGLLHPARRQLQQLGEDDVGVLALDAHRQPNHR